MTHAAIGLAALMPHAAHAQQPVAGDAVGDPALATLIRELRDPALPASARAAAADSLVASAASGPSLEVVAALLRGGPVEDGAWAICLDAVRRAASPPASLLPALGEGLRVAGAERAPAVIGAISSIRTKAACEMLLGECADDRTPAVRSAATAALARLTGATIGDDAAAWQAWYAARREWTEAEFARAVAGAHAQRADRAEARTARAAAVMVDLCNRLYVQIPADARPGFLAALIADAAPELRNLGFELATRELSARRRLNGEVAQAAAGLLANSSPSVRAQAAQLLVQVGDGTVADSIVRALLAEHEPVAAEPMLAAVSLWPSAESAPAVLRWVGSPGSLGVRAVAAVASLRRAGVTFDPDERARILAAVRDLAPAAITAHAAELLVTMGGEVEHDRLRALLRSDVPGARRIAAEAMAQRAAFLDSLLDAAADDHSLLPAACTAIAAHRPTPTAYRRVASIAAGLPSLPRADLLRAASTLPLGSLVEIASDAADPAWRAALLERVPADAALLDAAFVSAHAGTIDAALSMLAEARLASGQPDGCLQALDARSRALALDRNGYEAAPADESRLAALLWLGNNEAAAALDLETETWLNAMDRVLQLNAAADFAALLRTLESLLADALTDADRARLATMRERHAMANANRGDQRAPDGPGGD